ncbi:hypothetical protein [Streptomyces sp. NPDC101132]
MSLSIRDQLAGTVSSVTSVTADAVKDLGLAAGSSVVATSGR